VPVTTACAIAGVHRTTFYRWLRGSRPVEVGFRKQVEAATADATASLVQAMTTAALRDGSWRAAAWLLERRDPENWARARDRLAAAKEAEEKAKENPLAMVDDLAERRAADHRRKKAN
jgi:hypothetical protein